MWTQIRLQSDLGPHCLPVCKNKFEKFARIFSRQHKQMTFSDVGFLGVLRVNFNQKVPKFYFSIKTYVVGTHSKHLIKMLLMSTVNVLKN